MWRRPVCRYSWIWKEQIFIDILKKQLDTNLKLTVGNAILNNPIYIDYTASEGKKCLLYSVTSVNWSTERPSQPGNIEIIKIKVWQIAILPSPKEKTLTGPISQDKNKHPILPILKRSRPYMIIKIYSVAKKFLLSKT